MSGIRKDPPVASSLREEELDAIDVTGALHDVSNALTVLLGWVAEARADGAPRETVAYALGVVDRRARMARDLARRAIGAAPPESGEEFVDTVLADVLESLKVEAERARVRLGLHEVRNDKNEKMTSIRIRGGADVSNAVTNLLLNAIAFSPKDASVHVTTTATDLAVLIDVEDEGSGIAPARRATIFKGESTRPEGAGVGLRYARAVARDIGGDLEHLPPSGPGRGARFRLTWPRADIRVPPPPPSIAHVRSLEGKRVLIVEDDTDVIELLDTALTGRGAEITIARTASELQLLLSSAVGTASHDAALFDLSPIADDVEGALAILGLHSPKAAIVLITGSTVGLPPAIEESARLVRKPFEVHEIVEALLLGKR